MHARMEPLLQELWNVLMLAVGGVMLLAFGAFMLACVAFLLWIVLVAPVLLVRTRWRANGT